MLRKLFDWLGIRDSPINAFFLGIAYSLLGIGIATIIFPQNIGIVSVFLTSLALIPSINRLMKSQAKKELLDSKKKLTLVGIGEEYSHSFQLYFYAFFGIFIVFALLTMISPVEIQGKLFGEQIFNLYGNSTGQLTGTASAQINGCASNECLFVDIILNNLWVFFVIFAIALIFNSGAVFVITWNASVWAIAFANYAMQQAPLFGHHPLTYLVLIVLAYLPHTTFEALSYFGAAIAGNVVANGIAEKASFDSRLKRIILQAFIVLCVALFVLFLAAFIEVYAVNFFEWIFIG